MEDCIEEIAEFIGITPQRLVSLVIDKKRTSIEGEVILIKSDELWLEKLKTATTIKEAKDMLDHDADNDFQRDAAIWRIYKLY